MTDEEVGAVRPGDTVVYLGLIREVEYQVEGFNPGYWKLKGVGGFVTYRNCWGHTPLKNGKLDLNRPAYVEGVRRKWDRVRGVADEYC